MLSLIRLDLGFLIEPGGREDDRGPEGGGANIYLNHMNNSG